VEKALKALLVWHQVEFPKTHDVQRLLDLLAGTEPELAEACVGAAELTPYGVEYRYPGEYPPVDRDSATAALLVARKACHEVARRIRTG
jgi:HEPN domain-containing protein